MSELSEIAAIINGLDKPVIKTYTERGRGKKQCPKCKVIVGVRTKICSCGRVFTKQSKTTSLPRDPEVSKAINLVAGLGSYPSKGYSIIYAPVGPKPQLEKDGDVIEWATKIIHKQYACEKIVSPGCLRYLFANTQGTPEQNLQNYQEQVFDMKIIEELPPPISAGGQQFRLPLFIIFPLLNLLQFLVWQSFEIHGWKDKEDEDS